MLSYFCQRVDPQGSYPHAHPVDVINLRGGDLCRAGPGLGWCRSMGDEGPIAFPAPAPPAPRTICRCRVRLGMPRPIRPCRAALRSARLRLDVIVSSRAGSPWRQRIAAAKPPHDSTTCCSGPGGDAHGCDNDSPRGSISDRRHERDGHLHGTARRDPRSECRTG
jgi:hypothetical protein